jgi:hypothetical protein
MNKIYVTQNCFPYVLPIPPKSVGLRQGIQQFYPRVRQYLGSKLEEHGGEKKKKVFHLAYIT